MQVEGQVRRTSPRLAEKVERKLKFDDEKENIVAAPGKRTGIQLEQPVKKTLKPSWSSSTRAAPQAKTKALPVARAEITVSSSKPARGGVNVVAKAETEKPAAEDDGDMDLDALLSTKIVCDKFDYKNRIALQSDFLAKLKAMTVRIDNTRVQMVDDITNTASELEKAEELHLQETTKLRQALEAATAEAKKWKQQNVGLDVELRALGTAHTRLLETKAGHEAKLKEANKEKEEAQSQIFKAKQDLEQATQACTLQKASLDRARSELQLAQAAQSERMSEKKTELERMAAAAEEASSACKSKLGELEACQQVEASLRAQIDALKEEQVKIQGEKDELSSSFTGIADRIQTAEKQLIDVQGRLEVADQDLRESLRGFSQAQELHSTRLDELRSECEAATVSIDELNEKISAVQAELVSVRSECDKRGEQVASLTNTLNTDVSATKELAQATQQAAERLVAATEEHVLLEKAHAELNALFEAFKSTSGQSHEEQLNELGQLQQQNRELTESLSTAKAQMSSAAIECEELKEAMAELLENQIETDATRRRLHNDIQDLRGNIRVVARVRPPTADEGIPAISIHTDNTVAELNVGDTATSVSLDHVFGCGTSQEDVFDEVAHVVQSALDGYKVCLFAYGQTGSGKTFTMVGNKYPSPNAGVIPRAIAHILQASEEMKLKGWEYVLQASFLEIYNENVKDLLNDKGGQPLAIKQHMSSEDDTGDMCVDGLTWLPVLTSEDINTLMTKAHKNRSVGVTSMNEHSSRSHTVFSLKISASHPNQEQVLNGTLNLVDLAGSERLAKSGAVGDRLKETQAINKSLSALGDVLVALAKKSPHVPYRNSKLTYLLQPCLRGDGKCLMIVNLSPSDASAHESVCSLRFASLVHNTELGKAKRTTKTLTAPSASSSASVARKVVKK